MTLEEMAAEIKSLRQQQEDQKKNWALWARVSLGFALVLLIAMLTFVYIYDHVNTILVSIFPLFLFLGVVFANASATIKSRNRYVGSEN